MTDHATARPGDADRSRDPDRAEQPPATGDAEVDAALARVADLSGRDLDGQTEALTAAQAELQQLLDRARRD